MTSDDTVGRRLSSRNPDEHSAPSPRETPPNRETVHSPFARLSESSIHSAYHWWRLLERSTSSETRPEAKTLLRSALGLLNRFWHSCQLYARLASWHMLLLFVCCWLLLSLAGCLAAFRWATNIEASRRSQATSVAEELARFLGREMEQFFVPLYPLRLFVQRTRLIHLARIAESFPERDDSARWKDVSSVENNPEILDDFEGVMQGIWNSLDRTSREAVLSIQLQPRGVITMVSPLPGNEGAIGMHVLNEPGPSLLEAVNRSGPAVVGPVHLIQGAVGVLAYLPVYVDDDVDGALDTREMAGVEREVEPGKRFWGFVTAAANLTQMAEWSGAMRDFEHSNMHFQMSSEVHGANSTQAHRLFDSGEENFSIAIRVPRLHWTLLVGWVGGFWPGWFWPAVTGSICGAGVLAFLITMVLLSRKKHRMLLYRIMPRGAVKRLHAGRQVVQSFDTVTIFFSDLVGFTDLSSRSSPLEVVAMLNELYTEFDRLAKRHQVFKSDTIGDAYMVVGGAPDKCSGPEGAARVAQFALEALEKIEEKDIGLAMRAGLASGPVVAAVVGTAVPKYAFFGATVGTANVMESTGKAGALQITEETKALLEESGVQGLRFVEAVDGAARRQANGAPAAAYWVLRDERGAPPASTRTLRRRRASVRSGSQPSSPLQPSLNAGSSPMAASVASRRVGSVEIDV